MSYRISQQGFTLVEMIVALAVFSVVVTISIGALLSLVATNEQLQSERTVMTNLSFALDSVTREIRTGTAYYCVSGNAGSAPFTGNHEILSERTNDCLDGNDTGRALHGISFIESGDSITVNSGSATRILYYFDGTDSTNGKLMRRVGDDPSQAITSSGINILNAEFTVSNTATSSSNQIQPAVTIVIDASEAGVNTKSYRLQTTVVQRTLDL